MLVPGVASTLDVDRLRAAADQSATFRATLIRHGLAVYAQIQQTAGCNVAHTVESRLARCLLQMHDLSGSDTLMLTQESMAQMIGARRNSVSLVASTLQQANYHSLQPRTHRDHQPGRARQDVLRVLRAGEGAV